MKTEDLLNQIDDMLKPLLSDMIIEYDKTSGRCDKAYYVFSTLTIMLTAAIPALGAATFMNYPWVISMLGVVVVMLTGIQGRFRFEQRGMQWTLMLVEFESLQAKWDVFKLTVKDKPIQDVEGKITTEAAKIIGRIQELETRDVTMFYKGIAHKDH